MNPCKICGAPWGTEYGLCVVCWWEERKSLHPYLEFGAEVLREGLDEASRRVLPAPIVEEYDLRLRQAINYYNANKDAVEAYLNSLGIQ